MGIEFFNPWMLAGLAGLSLPVLAHLLSRKKYDVVEWGAMQFLDLRREARRRIRLEELLLMLLRMGLIAILAIGFARPLLSGGIAGWFASKPACDVVLVIDSSYSTDWRGGARTPRQAAVSWAKQFVQELGPEDTVAVIDARGSLSTPVPTLTRDRQLVLETLDDLPQPSGSSRINDAAIRGLQIVNSGANVSRHVIVLTDGQSHPWRDADEHFWLQLKELRSLATVPSDVWVVSTQKQQATAVNDALAPLKLSRELTVIDFPIRVRTELTNSGSKVASNRQVFLEVDGQRLAKKTISVRVEPDGQASIEFEHRFTTTGSHVVSVVLEGDNLPADDRADAVVSVAKALPVLLIDGTPHPDATRSEVFFARSALSAGGNLAPWVATRTVSGSAFESRSIEDAQVIVLANVQQLSDSQVEELTAFVDGGGGLVVTCGDQVDRASYNDRLFADGRGLLPAFLESAEAAARGADAETVRIEPSSLSLSWLEEFQSGSDGFLDARFSRWLKATLTAPVIPDRDAATDAFNAADISNAADADSGRAGQGSASAIDTGGEQQPAMIGARLTNGDPLLVTRSYGRGQVALWTSSIDADWGTLPTQPDYVAFLHELIFHMASGRATRNVDAGTPLIFPIEPGRAVEEFVFVAPDGSEHPAIAAGKELRPSARFDDTFQPGLYRLREVVPGGAKPVAARDELFVVNFDRSESDLTAITDDRWSELTADERFRRIEEPDEMFSAITVGTARAEVWQGLLLIFLLILIGEVVMTRRLVQGGHHETAMAATAAAD
jgi:hypothetical protein